MGLTSLVVWLRREDGKSKREVEKTGLEVESQSTYPPKWDEIKGGCERGWEEYAHKGDRPWSAGIEVWESFTF